MNQIKKVIIFGIGGTSIDILDVINDINESSKAKLECIGFLDDEEEKVGEIIGNVKVLGSLNIAKDFKNTYFINGIGSPNNFFKKDEIIKKTSISLDKFLTIIHPSATVSKTAQVGSGSVIFQNVTINSNVKIGNHVVILPNSVLGHDCVIGDYTCVASMASISGGIDVGKCCYIGSNSVIKEFVKIGEYSLVGMGSVVLEDVSPNSVYVGNPAKFLRKIKF